MGLSLGEFNEQQKDWSEHATTALRNNLCEFPAMFAKYVLISVADEFHTATVTLLDLGYGPLAVTCAHAITDYLERWRAGRALIRVGNIRVSALQLAGFDKDVDLATIRLSDEQAADLASEAGSTESQPSFISRPAGLQTAQKKVNPSPLEDSPPSGGRSAPRLAS